LTLRIGILGAARVATYAMIDAAHDVDDVAVMGVAARDPERARVYAAKHGIPAVFKDYDALIASPDIDAIYNALPPNLHAQWSIAAVEVGKPVLCEKPFALSVTDVEAMIAAEMRTGCLIMEAQHTHYHPINIRARAAIAGGEIGTVRHIRGCFTTDIPHSPTELRWDYAVGGGALWDLGVYPAYWLRSMTSEEPIVVSAQHRLFEGGADTLTYAKLAFPSGATGELSCDMISDTQAWVNVEGSAGTLDIFNPLSAARPQKITITRGSEVVTETFSTRPSYSYQLEAFRDAIVLNAPCPTHGADSLATIRLLCAIRDAAMKE
jgi:predicted dehydrogenase